MSSDKVSLEIGISVQEIHEALDDVEEKAKDTKRAVDMTIHASMRALRKTTQLAILMSEAVFGSMDAVMRYAIEGALMSAELITTIMVAESFTLVGALKVGVQFASIVAIYTQVARMVQGRSDQAQQMGRVAIFLRTLSQSF